MAPNLDLCSFVTSLLTAGLLNVQAGGQGDVYLT